MTNQSHFLCLQRPDLLQQKALINNEWHASLSGERLAVVNPFNQQLIGYVPLLTDEQINLAIDGANRAWRDWAKKTAEARALLLQAWADLIEQHKNDLAIILTSEQGKPIKESLGEIDYALGYLRFFAEEGKRIYGDTIPSDKTNMRYMVLKQPVGVCACITPWNFPVAMFARKVAPALASGCAMIVKPASQTPFSALAWGVLAIEAGLPRGLFQIVTGQADLLGRILTQDVRIAKFSFTGSTQVGRKLMQQCGDSLKRISMELGGNAPFIVFEDADLDKAVEGLLASKYRNAGQTCVCANRIYLHNDIHDEFVKRFCQKVQMLKVGDGLSYDTDIGAMIDQEALQKAQSLIHSAIDDGAKLMMGGQIDDISPLCLQPTVLVDVTDDMQIAQTEIFAPITAIYRFDDEDDVVRRANDTIFGLACYFYTNDMKRSWRICESLEYGMIGQNTGMISTALAPFGGIKQSGFGREGSKYGMDDYLNIKYWAMDIG